MGLLSRVARLWDWVRGVIVEQGEPERVPIHLERASDGSYWFRVDVRTSLAQDTARIPISTRRNPAEHPILKEIHSCEVAGQLLEAANSYALRAKVAAQLEAIAPARALPLCYFRVVEMDYDLPVYEDGGRVVSPVLGGPQLKARDLAEMRGVVCRYLISAGYVHEPDQVTVGVLRPSDLRRVPPAAVFRSLDDPDLWMPSVEGVSPDGPVVGLLGEAARLRRRVERLRAGVGPIPGAHGPAAPDVIELLRFLRSELSRGGQVDDPGALYASEVRGEIWSAAERHTDDTGRRLVAHLSDDERTTLELPIRQTGFGEVVTALEDRGINVLLAHDADALAAAVGRYLARHDFLRFASEVEIHDSERPRAERLEPEAIRISGEDYSFTNDVHDEQPEEVVS